MRQKLNLKDVKFPNENEYTDNVKSNLTCIFLITVARLPYINFRRSSCCNETLVSKLKMITSCVLTKFSDKFNYIFLEILGLH